MQVQWQITAFSAVPTACTFGISRGNFSTELWETKAYSAEGETMAETGTRAMKREPWKRSVSDLNHPLSFHFSVYLSTEEKLEQSDSW